MCETLQTLVIATLELLSSTLIMYGVFQRKCRSKFYYHIILFLFFILIIILTVYSGNVDKLSILSFMAELIFITISFCGSFIYNVLLYILSYIISYIITSLEVTLLSLLFNTSISCFIESWEYYLIIMIFNILFVLMISIFIRKKETIKVVLSKIPLKYLLIGIIGLFLSALILVYVIVEQENYTNNVLSKVIVHSSGILCIFFMVGSIVFSYVHNSKKILEDQNKLNKKIIEMQKNYYQQIIKNDIEVRRLSHDMVSHIGCMKILLNEKKFDDLALYINEISQDVDLKLRRKINSGNSTIDAFLNYLYQLVDSEQIEIKLQGKCSDEIGISGPDLSILISNLVINAIDSCKSITSSYKNIIDIIIKNNSNLLYLSVENPVDNVVDIDLLKRGTNKKDKRNHGFGIGNIERVVRKYSGDIQYINEEGRFRVEILLWID